MKGNMDDLKKRRKASLFEVIERGHVQTLSILKVRENINES